MAKGSSFEREICKTLSLWWTGGERSDVFWRSSQSGGRATQRAKTGKRTFGSYGDISAVDPIGQPLLKLFTIELKRGRSHGCPNDLFDCRRTKKMKPFEQALEQAISSAELAGSYHWMLLSRRDGRETVAYFPPGGFGGVATQFLANATDLFRLRMRLTLANGRKVDFVGYRLADLLQCAEPHDVIYHVRQLDKR